MIRVGASLTGLVSSFKTGQQAVGDFTNKLSAGIEKNKASINTLSTGLGVVGAGLTGLAVLAVKRFADFDQAMSAVGAATMETAGNMESLRTAALEAGADTQYSATQAAGAVEALAKAGVKTTDILKGGLTGALNLAASAQMDVGEAAEIAATTMNQFGLEGKDASHIADLLAAAAGKAMGDVTDMSGALKFVGPVAHQMGISLEETAGTIAYLAQQGVLGEQAGTSLRGMLSSLTSPSQIAAKEMKNLGINVYDTATGAFVGFNGIAQQMKETMGGLTDAERDQAFGRIFGNEQITTARLLYLGGAGAIDTWTASVNDSGYAAEQARIKTDNLKGDLERLGGSLDTALIQSGSGANDVLREMAQRTEAVVDWIGSLSDEALSATTMIAGAGGLALLGVAGLGKLVVAVSEVKAALTALKISAGVATAATAAVGGALLIGTSLLSQWASAAAESKQNTEDFTGSLDEATGAVTASTEALVADKVAKAEAGRIYKNLGGNVSDLTGYVLGNADAIERVNALLDAQPQDAFLWWEGDNNGVAQVKKDLNGLSGDLTDSKDKWEILRQAMGGAATEADTTTDAQKSLRVSTDDTTFSVEDQTEAIKTLIDAQSTLAGNVLSLRDAQRNLEDAYDNVTDSITENGTTLDITTEKGRANQAAIDAVAKSGWDLITSMQANGSTQEDLQATMQSTRDRFIEVAQQFGISAEEANGLADQMGLIPANVTVTAQFDSSNADTNMQAFINRWAGQTVTVQGIMDTTGLDRSMAASAARYTALALASAGKAGGGAVYGPGTGTSDTAGLYRLSNGEHVLTASDVSKMGGQSAVYNLRKSVQTGMADGGAVYASRQYVPAPQYATAAPMAAAPVVEPIDYTRLARAMAGVQIGLDGRRVSQSVDQRMGDRWR